MPVPKERDFLGSLNTIKSLTESTCADKWDIFIETAFPAAGEALWLLLVPDPGEILENYLNPRSRRSARKRGAAGTGKRQVTRYGQLRWWQKISFPDVDQIIADQLPGAEAVQGRKVGTAQQWLWQGIDAVDRVLWYWLLIEVGRTFIVEWGSGIVESRFCTSNFVGIFSGNANVDSILLNNHFWALAEECVPVTNQGWHIRDQGRIERENPTIPMKGQIVASLSGVAELDGSGGPGRMRILVRLDMNGGQVQLWESNIINLTPGQGFEVGINFNAENFSAIAFLTQRIDGGVFKINECSSSFTAFATFDD